MTAQAATPQEGVPLKVRTGFFTETDIGGFLTLGGDDAYSNLQAYLQLGVGYQFNLGDEDKHYIPVGLHVGIGASAGNCYAGRVGGGGSQGACPQADSFTATFINASVGYMRRIIERLYVGGRVMGGYTLLDPAPVANVKGGIDLGGAIGLEYATNMDHFTIGVDVVYRLIIGANVHSLQFFPRVKYTF
ncbi:MAG: adventurous gliding motility protein CglE [Myxococcaceae bacterium]|nr:adventurous gliding motility protein CglE [Myxococcaceae bacterium]